MAFPYIHESNWESNAVTPFGWDTETDTDGKLAVKHFKELGSSYGLTPYRGAYALLVDLTKGVTNAAVLTETSDFDLAAGGSIYVAGRLFVKSLTGLAASDSMSLFVLDSAGPVVEVDLQIYNNAGTYQLRCGDGTTYRACALEQNKWIHWEFYAVIDSGGGNDGTLDFYVEGTQIGAQITGIDQAAITQARLGFIANTVAAGTKGFIVHDELIADDARIYPQNPRFSSTVMPTKSAHLFVGPGTIAAASLASTNADDKITFYDTDNGDTTTAPVAELWTSATDSISSPITFNKGCYAVLTGTEPKGFVSFMSASDVPSLTGPVYLSDWGYRYLASRT